jgi:hypothetical protein
MKKGSYYNPEDPSGFCYSVAPVISSIKKDITAPGLIDFT